MNGWLLGLSPREKKDLSMANGVDQHRCNKRNNEKAKRERESKGRKVSKKDRRGKRKQIECERESKKRERKQIVRGS